MLPSLTYFNSIFAFVIVFAISFGVLIKIKLFGERSTNAIIAAIFGVIASFHTPFLSIISDIIPLIVIFLLFIFVLILFFLFFGVKDTDISSVIKQENNATMLVAIVAIIFVFVLIKQFGPSILEASVWSNKYLLGVIIFFVIAGMTVKLLAYEQFVPKK